MSGIINSAGSKSGVIDFISKEWKHLYRSNLTSSEDGGSSVVSWHASHGLRNGVFTFYKLIGTGIQGNDSQVRELGLRWSCVSGSTAGYSTNGYYGGRWAQHHDGSFISAQLTNAAAGRVAYLNAPDQVWGVTGMEILLSNPGVGDPTGGTTQTGAICHTVGYVSSTSSAGHGGVTAYIMNNNTSASTTGSNGEISAISLTVNSGTFAKGTVDIYGLVK